MQRPFILALLLLPLLACGDKEPDDTAGPEDTDAIVGDCETEPGGNALTSGSYTTLTEEALDLGCENEAGNGAHVHVGESIPFEITRTGYCIDAVSESGTPNEIVWTGMSDGESMELTASLEEELGTCVLQVEFTMDATMQSETSFEYRIDGTISVKEELSPDACSFIVGETEKHTFPELPCSWAWAGSGTLD